MVIAHAVDQLNETLNVTGYKIHLTFEEPEKFDGVATVISEKNVSEYLGFSGCKPVDPIHNGYACMRIDRETFLLNRISAVAVEELPPDFLRSTMLEELYQSLGVTNDHSFYDDSINFADGGYGSMQPTPGIIDKKTLVFLYKYIKPGDDEATVRQKFDQYWSTIQPE